MNYNLRFTLYYDAFADAFRDRDAFASYWSHLPVWGDETDSNDVPADRIELLGRIWDLAHLSLADLCELSGMSEDDFANRFMLPIYNRNPLSERSQTPFPITYFIAQALGLVGDDLVL